MNPKEFLESIYLGDRACKAILIDSWNNRVAIQVTVISRVRPGTKSWNFYTDADILDPHPVFSKLAHQRRFQAEAICHPGLNQLCSTTSQFNREFLHNAGGLLET